MLIQQTETQEFLDIETIKNINIVSNNYNFQQQDPTIFNQGFIGDMDIGNIVNSLHPISDTPSLKILTKLSYISPGYLYDCLDVFSRDALLYLSNDLGWGISYAIIGITLAIKLFYMPFMIITQRNAMKLKLLEPEMNNFSNLQQRLGKTGDYAQMKIIQKQLSALKKQHGIHNWVAFAQLSQLPFLITWFLSLRYLSTLTETYPQLLTDGLFWFKNLSEMDTYYILPVLNATISFLNISLNPNMQNYDKIPGYGQIMSYFKFLPFFSLPIVIYFPASLNLYWCVSSTTHLFVTLLSRSSFIKVVFKIPEYLPGSILEKLNSQQYQQQQQLTEERINNQSDSSSVSQSNQAPVQQELKQKSNPNDISSQIAQIIINKSKVATQKIQQPEVYSQKQQFFQQQQQNAADNKRNLSPDDISSLIAKSIINKSKTVATNIQTPNPLKKDLFEENQLKSDKSQIAQSIINKHLSNQNSDDENKKNK